MNAEEHHQRALNEDQRLSPDPELNLSGGQASAGQIAWIGFGVFAVIALLIYGLSQGDPQRIATSPDRQAVPPATSSAESGARPPTPAQPSGDQNTGANTGVRENSPQRSQDVEAIGGGSRRNPGSGEVAPPKRD